jgi:uncharacterized membrane protein/mono/diheme cytochrome c family protein
MKFLLPSALLLFAVLATGAAVEGPGEGAVLAGKVREIFEAKCLDCHGPELPRPKGKFGYVLDLKRIAENPEYVVRKDPDKSDIYVMVRDDEMPGEDANVPALTPDEKEAVRRWIELGAPDAPLAAAERAVPSAVVAAEVKTDRALWKKVSEWIGRFHPVSTHFPVALMLVAVFAESLAWWTRRESWLHTVRFLVILAALGAVSAGVLGWINAYFSSYSKETGALLWWHRWLGTGSSVWAIVCAVLIVLHECREGSPERQRFRGALLLGAALIGISGFLGSALIYGLDHYAWK